MRGHVCSSIIQRNMSCLLHDQQLFEFRRRQGAKRIGEKVCIIFESHRKDGNKDKSWSSTLFEAYRKKNGKTEEKETSKKWRIPTMRTIRM